MRKLLYAILCSAMSASGAIICVGPSATGTGSGADWNNQAAWSSLSFARGNTYYLVDGSYGGKNITTAVSGSSYITIKKAVTNDSAVTSIAGWSATYGDGVAAFTGTLNFWNSYIIFDGVRSVDYSTNRNNYGFNFIGVDTAMSYGSTPANQAVHDITVSHIYASVTSGDREKDMFWGSLSSTPGSTSNITNSHNCGDGFITQIMVNVSGMGNSNWLIEYNMFAHPSDGIVEHGGAIDVNYGNLSNSTIRYNCFIGYDPTAVTGGKSQTATIEANNSDINNCYIYGNVFNGVRVSNGIISGTSSGVINNTVVYNNTFISEGTGGMPWVSASGGHTGGGGNVAYNNLVYSMTAGVGDGFTSDYNTYYNDNAVPSETHGQVATLGSTPFNNAAAGDYTLKTNTAPGTALTAPFNVDMLGNTRTTWTRGAIEYASAPPPITTYYASPNGLTNNTGTSTASPWPLQYALDNAGASNTLIVMDGAYTPSAGNAFYIHGAAANGLTVRAQNKWKAVVRDSTFYGLQIYSATAVTIDGLCVSNSAYSGIKLMTPYSTVRNCWITRNGIPQDDQGIASNSSGVQNNTFEYNLVEFNGSGGGYGHAIYFNGPNNIVRGNVCRYNGGFGIHLYGSGSVNNNLNHIYNNLCYGQTNRTGIVCYGAADGGGSPGVNYIYGNTVLDGIECDYGTVYLTNNIVRASPLFPGTPITPNQNRPPSTLREDYNLSDQSCGGGAHDVITAYGATWFVNPAAGQYYLGSSSPARNMALAGVCGPVNFYGAAQASVADAGAWQYDLAKLSDPRNLETAPADFWTATSGGGTAPTITAQPQSSTISATSNATFVVVTTGSPSYQWKLNGINISGATLSSYTTNGVPKAASGNVYSVGVTNASGGLLSGNATLTVTNPVGVLSYSQAPLINPMKGAECFVHNSAAEKARFGHSVELEYLSLRDISTGSNTFNWAVMDSLLQRGSSNGCMVEIRPILDNPSGSGTLCVPQWLIDLGVTMHQFTNSAGVTNLSLSPDYEHPMTRHLITNTVYQMALRYNGDPRLAFVCVGFLGHWGEFHCDNYNDPTTGAYPPYASKATEDLLFQACTNWWTTTKQVLRYPIGGAGRWTSDHACNTNYTQIGYTDHMFNWSSFDTDLTTYSWYFMRYIADAGYMATNKWKTQLQAGEIDANTISSGLPGNVQWTNVNPAWRNTGQNWTNVAGLEHPSIIHDDSVFSYSAATDAAQKANATNAYRKIGYELHIPGWSFANNTLTLTVSNTGIAPFYYPWQIQVQAVQGTTTNTWTTTNTIAGILPGTATNLSAQLVGIKAGANTLSVRVVNPLTNGIPLSFANETQNTTNGWLALPGNVTGAGNPPSISVQPSDTTITVGNSASFGVVASGTDPLLYQWYLNGSAVVGETLTSFSASPPTVGTNTVQVVVTNSYGTAVSRLASLVVRGIAPTIKTQPQGTTLPIQSSWALSVEAGGTAPFTYQWYRAGSPVAGATMSFYGVLSMTPATNSYTVVVSGPWGSALSQSATVTWTNATIIKKYRIKAGKGQAGRLP